jgi:O-antigen/teichoic acid export membrane protein
MPDMMEANAATPDSLTRKALVGTSWSALSNIARQALSFASVAVLARLLGPSAYGLMGMATLVLSFLANFRDLGTATAIIQRPQVSKRLLSSLFWVNCGLGVLLACAGFIGAVPAAAFFHEPKLVALLRVISLSFCITTVGAVPNSVLVRNMAFGKIAIADFFSALIGYAVAIPCAYAGLGVWSLVIGNLANFTFATILYILLCGWRPSLEFDPAELRSVSGFSLNLAGFGIVNYFARNADNVVVGRVLGSVQLGYYQMAYNLFLFPIQNISSIIGQVLNPAFSKIQNENERFRSAYIRGCMLIGLITFPVMAGLGVVADPFIRTLLGAKWLAVIPLLQILVPVGVFQSVHGTVGQIFIAKGRTDWMFRFGLYASTMWVASFLVGVRWGTRGVATAYAITYFVFVLYPGLRIPFKLIGLTVGEFVRHLWPQIAITLGMAAVCAGWMMALSSLGFSNVLLRLISTILIGAAVYILAMLVIRPAVILHLEEVIETSRIPFGVGLLRIIRSCARN